MLPDPPLRPPRPSACGHSHDDCRRVTAEQLDHALLQLRERRGRTPVEQLGAVLRALDMTAVPAPRAPRD